MVAIRSTSIRGTRGLALLLAAFLLVETLVPAFAFAGSNDLLDERDNYWTETLAPPTLVAPSGEVLECSPTFLWQPVPGATRYEIDVLKSDGTRVHRRDGIQETSYTIPGAARLDLDTDYSFTVRAYNHQNHEASPYATPLEFRPVRWYSNQPPVAEFQATPTSGYAPLSVQFDASGSSDPEGHIVDYSWDFDSNGSIDATGVTTSHVFESPGTYPVSLAVTDDRAAKATAQTTITAMIPLPTVSISAVPAKVNRGGAALLSWTSTNADSVVIEPEIGPVLPQGSMAVFPDADTTYVITAANSSGATTSSTAVHVNWEPTAVCSADATSGPAPLTIAFDGSLSSDPDGSIVDYAWDFDGDGTVEEHGASATHSYQTAGSYTARLTVTDDMGETGSATQPIDAFVPLPTVEMSVTPETIVRGGSAILSWRSTNADTVTIEPGVGQVLPAGSTVIGPTADTTYTVTVENASGTSSAQAAVRVLNTAPQPEGAFGEAYQDLVPADVTVESLDATRFAVVTGLVHDRAGEPLSGVRVAAHGHPEYGSAVTDSSGRFSLPVEGGSTVSLDCEKPGFLSALREVQVPWNDVAVVEDVILVQPDVAAAEFALDGNASHVVAHKSTPVADEAGTRACTVVLTGDNRAWAKGTSGVETQLTTITVRASEFDTPAAMPAVLPPISAYTYCAELAVDETTRPVRFEKPIAVYVDNFLGFAVGEPVPVGSFDRQLGEWVPEKNGVVVRLLDRNADGAVDSLDRNGDGQADDLNGNGSVTDDAQGLSDPTRYVPGSTYWRVTVSHFTPFDLNWPWGLPPGAGGPNAGGPPFGGGADGCRIATGSQVSPRGRVLSEDIPIPGTEMTLEYASDRTPGHKYVITVPASGNTVWPALKRIETIVTVAGRRFTENLAPAPNQNAEFAWDGLDYRGQPVSRSTYAHAIVRYVYDAHYYSSRDDATASFAQAGDAALDIDARQEAFVSKSYAVAVPVYDRTGDLAEGWALSAQRKADPSNATIYRPDGTKPAESTLLIRTVAGNGIDQYAGDGGLATQTGLTSVARDIAIDAAGNVYIAASNRVLRVDAKTNLVFTVAGNGMYEYFYAGDGGLAVQTAVSPNAVALDDRGALYIADSRRRVLKVLEDGTLRTVAGNGNTAVPLNGVLATQTAVMPRDLAFDRSGSLYIAQDIGYYCLRKVDPSGIINTIAGNGQLAFNGDNRPATSAAVVPVGVAADSVGNIYIADYYNNRVREVDTSGTITTVAGGTYSSNGGDGGPANRSWISPVAVALDAQDNLYISDDWSQSIRRVFPDGTIKPAVGVPRYLNSNPSLGDGGPASQAGLNYPGQVVFDGAGSVYVVDRGSYSGGRRVRKAAPESTWTRSLEAVPEEGGDVGYRFSASGRHLATFDLDSGVDLATFSYGSDGELDGIADTFGSTLTIQRNAQGTPTGIRSPDGVVTQLSVDENNHLARVTYPDASHYDFGYTADGLMTDEFRPAGGHSRREFDANGLITTSSDPEGGMWSFSTTKESSSAVTSRVQTSENNLTTYTDRIGFDGDYSSSIVGPGCATNSYYKSADGMKTSTSIAGGPLITETYGLDKAYGHKYVKEAKAAMPSGLTSVVQTQRDRRDQDSDGQIDTVVETETANGKPFVSVDRTRIGQLTLTSAENRSAQLSYDPNNLLTSAVSASGLLPTSFMYDSRGRVTRAQTGDRFVAATYDSNGNLDTLTAADGKVFDYDYDVMDRLRAEERPDGTRVAYSYDANGNMTALTTASDVSHGFDYNGNDQRASYATPLSGTYLYSYDKERNLTGVAMPSGAQISATYTNGFLTGIDSPDGQVTLLRGR